MQEEATPSGKIKNQKNFTTEGHWEFDTQKGFGELVGKGHFGWELDLLPPHMAQWIFSMFRRLS